MEFNYLEQVWEFTHLHPGQEQDRVARKTDDEVRSELEALGTIVRTCFDVLGRDACDRCQVNDVVCRKGKDGQCTLCNAYDMPCTLAPLASGGFRAAAEVAARLQNAYKLPDRPPQTPIAVSDSERLAVEF